MSVSVVLGTSTVPVGGLVGSNYGGPGSVSASFWNTTVAAGVSTGIGYDPSAYGGAIGMSDADMKVMANFNSATVANGNIKPGWNITNTGGSTTAVWRIYEDKHRAAVAQLPQAADGHRQCSNPDI